jgi:hypothetical protein
MKRKGDNFVPAAFYVSKQKPADWAKDSAAVVVVRFKLLEESPRLVFTWGTWRKARGRSKHA